VTFPQSFLDDIRARLPVSAVVSRRVKLQRVGREFKGLSPFNKERTPSLFVNDAKQFWHDFSSGKHGDIFSFITEMEALTFPEAVKQLATMAGLSMPQIDHPVEDEARRKRLARERDLRHRQDEARQRGKAHWLWSRRQPIIEGSPPWLYLRRRGYDGPTPATLGYLSTNGEHPPALIAAFRLAAEIEPGIIAPLADVSGVHLTKLTPSGDKAAIEPVKIMVGPSMGLPIMLAPPNDLLGLAITEGIEDGLSVYAATGLGVWAAGAAGRMPALAAVVPDYIEAVTIYAHDDPAGQRHATALAGALAKRSVEVFIQGLA
jgi:hypothetical protein